MQRLERGARAPFFIFFGTISTFFLGNGRQYLLNREEGAMEFEIKANAKINLALDVLGEREDGYHEIDTIMQEIDLYDTITIDEGRGGFVLSCDDPALELDDRNLVYRAWALLKERAANPSVVIHIEKRIPIAAGLAGGSSDCAATLVGLNRLWGLNLEVEELAALGAQLGSDVPFFLYGGTARATGRGEIIEPLKSFRGRDVLLVNCGESLSSRYVYERVKTSGQIPMEELIDHMAVDAPKAYSLMANVMEPVSFEKIPELKDIVSEMERSGAIVARMSGSGPTVFGIFENTEVLEQAKSRFEKRYTFVFPCHTI